MDFIDQRATRKRLKKIPQPAVEIEPLGGTSGFSKAGNAYRNTRSGYREDMGQNFRSAWEANLARVLHIHGIKYEFEPKTFVFPIKRGTKAYIPDFYLPATDEWIEVKGYLDNKSRIKLKRFRIYYPDEADRMKVVLSKYAKSNMRKLEEVGITNFLFYEDLAEYKHKIPTWEGK